MRAGALRPSERVKPCRNQAVNELCVDSEWLTVTDSGESRCQLFGAWPLLVGQTDVDSPGYHKRGKMSRLLSNLSCHRLVRMSRRRG